ncbi:MAG: T9SS type A sorting domain-containing protein, partial [bacterium]|nr:T9SS type A sorting domain-containing protein [bacterium]
EGVLGNGQVLDLTREVVWFPGSDVLEVDGEKVMGLAPGRAQIRPTWGGIWGDQVEIAVETAPTAASGEDFIAEPATGVTPPGRTISDGLPGPNRPPYYVSEPESLAVSGLTYTYVPIIRGADGDTLDQWLASGPQWLHPTRDGFAGIAPNGSQPTTRVAFAATDGQDTIYQWSTLRVSNVAELASGFFPGIHFAGSQYVVSLPFSQDYDLEIDGPWEWQRLGHSLVVKAMREGQYPLGVAISRGNSSAFSSVNLDVARWPMLELSGVVLDPMEDHSGDGVVDPRSDQMIFVQNVGITDVDLTGCRWGEAQRAGAIIDTHLLLRPGEYARGFADHHLPLEARDMSAGGIIGDGLDAGDEVIVVAANRQDTLLRERIPDLPNGKLIARREGRWATDLSFESFDRLTIQMPAGVDLPEEAIGLESEDAFHRGGGFITEPRPNPFHQRTQLDFSSPGGEVTVTVYSILGQPIRYLLRQRVAAGPHSLTWDGTDGAGRQVSTGVYFIHHQDNQTAYTHRVVLLR